MIAGKTFPLWPIKTWRKNRSFKLQLHLMKCNFQVSHGIISTLKRIYVSVLWYYYCNFFNYFNSVSSDVEILFCFFRTITQLL
jgi:hypothetical protein